MLYWRRAEWQKKMIRRTTDTRDLVKSASGVKIENFILPFCVSKKRVEDEIIMDVCVEWGSSTHSIELGIKSMQFACIFGRIWHSLF